MHAQTQAATLLHTHFSAQAHWYSGQFVLVVNTGAQLVLETGGLGELCSRQQPCRHAHTHTHTHAVPGYYVCQLQATKRGRGERARQSVCEKERKQECSQTWGTKKEGCWEGQKLLSGRQKAAPIRRRKWVCLLSEYINFKLHLHLSQQKHADHKSDRRKDANMLVTAMRN